MSRIVPAVVAQHAAEMAFLWSLRDGATDHPRYDPWHLARLDARVQAHLDALRVAGGAGFDIAAANMKRFGGPGELFVVALMALESRDEAMIDAAFEFAAAVPESQRGLLGALGWARPDVLRGRVVSWLAASSVLRRLAAVAACSSHRVNPAQSMEDLLADEPIVRARALRLAGELGQVEVLPRVQAALEGKDDVCRFWAAWSAGLLGDRTASIPALKEWATGPGRFQLRAQEVLTRLLERGAAIDWVRDFGRDPSHARLMVISTGILGDPVVVPWLIEKMNVPMLARVAGTSFSMITGADLDKDELEGQVPTGFTGGSTEEPSDDNLPWPDAAKVKAWWDEACVRFTADVRYLSGRPVTPNACYEILSDGNQWHRRAAAYELALTRPDQSLWNWRARSDVLVGRRHASTST